MSKTFAQLIQDEMKRLEAIVKINSSGEKK